MACRVSVVIFLFLLLGSVITWSAEAIDCRKYVFAARCRGISAKRAQIPPLQYRDFENGFLSSPKHLEDATEDRNNDYDNVQIPDDYLRTLLRKYLGRVSAATAEDSET